VALEGGIGFGLDRIDRNLPAVLFGDDRFIVPVGALDETHRNRQILAPGPGEQGLQIRIGLLQVGLEGDAEVGIVAELLTGPQAAVDLEVMSLKR